MPRVLLLLFGIAAFVESLQPGLGGWSASRTRQRPVDLRMEPKYKELAVRAAGAASRLPLGRQLWIAVAGGPGAGKSTLASAVAKACSSLGCPTAVLAMDGFHYSKAELRHLDPPDASKILPRRGAPHTFDAEGLMLALQAAKTLQSAQLPTYSRVLSDPVPGGAVLSPSDRVVIVEGNYLLLGLLAEKNVFSSAAHLEATGLTVAQASSESKRWAPLLSLFDETWFVAPRNNIPGGAVSEQRRRLINRHLETWSDEKTAAWGAQSAEEGAAKRTDFNDIPNAHLVELCRCFSDIQIEST